jgi:hypothetical protein
VPSLPVKPELGPTLPELVAPWWRRAPRVLRIAVVAAAALVVALVALRLAGGPSGDTTVVVEEPVAFNLRFGGTLERVDPGEGEMLRLESRREGRLDQSFTVTPLELPAYRGLPVGALPVQAEDLKQRLAAEHRDFVLVEEGRMTINELPGYEVVFAARDEQDRRVYGRWIMMLPDEPGAREGVTLQLLARWSSRVPSAQVLGDQGQLKLPMRSFRFGTETP